MRRRTAILAGSALLGAFAGCTTTDGETATGAKTATPAPSPSAAGTETPVRTDCYGERARAALPAEVPEAATVHEYAESDVAGIPRLTDLLAAARDEYAAGEERRSERRLLVTDRSDEPFPEGDAIERAIGRFDDYYVRYRGVVFVLRYEIIEC